MSGIHTSAALLDMKASQGQTSSQCRTGFGLLEWTRSNSKILLRIKSFVHMLLSMSMQIWSCLCERFADDEKKALSVFLSWKWRSDDLLECAKCGTVNEHGEYVK
jgi:hypothetical protein